MLTAIVLLVLALRTIIHAITPSFAAHRAVRVAGGIFAALGLGLGSFLLFTGQALAAEAATADLRPLWGYGVEVLGGGLSVLAGIATRAVTKHLSVRSQDRIRDYLERALQLAIQFATELARRRGDDLAQVQVRDELVATAASYAARTVPDALRTFGIDEQGLKDRLRARLPEVVPHPAQTTVID
jgi:hypothetical protein